MEAYAFEGGSLTEEALIEDEDEVKDLEEEGRSTEAEEPERFLRLVEGIKGRGAETGDDGPELIPDGYVRSRGLPTGEADLARPPDLEVPKAKVAKEGFLAFRPLSLLAPSVAEEVSEGAGERERFEPERLSPRWPAAAFGVPANLKKELKSTDFLGVPLVEDLLLV